MSRSPHLFRVEAARARSGPIESRDSFGSVNEGV